MGRLKKPPIGELNGKIGHIVGRDFGYDHFISVRPDKYNVKKKFTEVSTKMRFHTAHKLAQMVVHFPELKEVWDKCKMPGKRGYTRLITANYKLLKDNLPTTENIITPKGVPLFFDMLEVSNTGIKCTYNLAGKIEPPFCLTFIILFFNPYNPESGLNSFSIDRKYINPDNAGESMDVTEKKYFEGSSIEGSIRENRKLYQNAILYAAVASTAEEKKKKWWTSTFAIDITGFKMKFIYLPQQIPQVKRKEEAIKAQNTNSRKLRRQQG
jgi:hypothetical protein